MIICSYKKNSIKITIVMKLPSFTHTRARIHMHTCTHAHIHNLKCSQRYRNTNATRNFHTIKYIPFDILPLLLLLSFHFCNFVKSAASLLSKSVKCLCLCVLHILGGVLLF